MSNRLHYLIQRFFSKTLTAEEKIELAEWVEKADDESLVEMLKHGWESEERKDDIQPEPGRRQSEPVYLQQLEVETNIPAVTNRVKAFARLAVAAMLIIVMGMLAYQWLMPETKPLVSKTITRAKTSIPEVQQANDNKAMLTLSDGSVITLDSAANGLLAKNANSTVIKLANGQLAYQVNGGQLQKVLFNTLTTQTGGQYSIALPDGSKVWLNAASSIRFPTVFQAGERRVQITGELYFEIATLPTGIGNGKVPFIVEIISESGNKREVQVLGTHFNVNAYEGEEGIRTTLLEGAVKVVHGSRSGLLVPGEQAVMKSSGEIKLLKGVDVDKAVAWKNGYFQFDRASLPAVLREAARWYDLEVVFEGNMQHDKFTGRIARSVSLQRFLKWLEWSDVQFKTTGKKIIVTQ